MQMRINPPTHHSLGSLSAQRRLVAPSVEESRGAQMLSPVDESTAVTLLAQGKSVYAVSGNTVDEGFTRRISASNNEQTTGYIQDEAFVKRTYSYKLKSLAEEGALLSLPPGQGLPPGLTAIHLEANSASKVVCADTQVGNAHIGSNHQSQSFSQGGFSGDPNISLEARRVDCEIVTSMNIRRPITLVGAIVGALAAGSLGTSPVGTLAGLLLGGVVGFELGTIAQRNMPAIPSRNFHRPPVMSRGRQLLTSL